MKDETRFRQNNRIIYIFITISFVWNLINTCQFYPREKEIQFDYMGVIVAILSILVTVLVCWNIFNYIQFERRIKEYVEKGTERLKQEIKSNEELLDKRIKGSVLLTKAEVYAVSSLSARDNDQIDISISLFYKSIDSYFEVPEPERKEDTFGVLSFLRHVAKILPTDVSLSDEQLKLFKKTAEKSGDSEIRSYTKKLIAFNNKQKEEKGEAE